MFLTLYTAPLFIFGISGGELLVILLVILMLFGSDKVPEMARGLARIINQVKNASNDIKTEITKNVDESGLIKDIKETVNVEDIKKRIGLDDLKKTVDDINPMNEVQQEIDKAKEDIETMTGPIKRQN
ncbi:MAG TPA: twin-arginine translocase TatA/TatE family subunit [Flavobacterium sp.]|nr:twin-arginine translocase TatA/TatE family subunit [Flavobacterium sp.]